MSKRQAVPREPAARDLRLKLDGEDVLNANIAGQVQRLLLDPSLVHETAAFALADCLDRLSRSKMGKVTALQELGESARAVLRQMGRL